MRGPCLSRFALGIYIAMIRPCNLTPSCRSLTPTRRRADWLTRWAGLCLLLVLGGGPRSALAVSGRSLVVLSISDGGRAQESLRARVSDFLKRAGARLVDLPRLAAADRSCEESTCLNRLAETHRAQLILGARIERHGPHDRIIYMWLYDARSGRDQSERQVCDARDLEERLSELAGQLIGPYLQDGEPAPSPREPSSAASAPESTPATTPPPEPVEPTPAGPVTTAPPPPIEAAQRTKPIAIRALPAMPPPPPHKRSALRTGLAIGLGILSVGALTTAIALTARSGQEADRSCHEGLLPCFYDYTPLYAPMYAAAGVLAASAILSLTLPSKKELR